MFKKIVFNHVEKYKSLYLKIAIIFIIGNCLGVFGVNWLDTDSLNITKEYLYNLNNSINNINDIKLFTIIYEVLKKEFSFLGIIFFLSCSIIGEKINYFLYGYKGFSTGYVISSIFRIYGIKKGVLLFCITLGIYKIIYIPIFTFFCVNSINFCKKIKNKSKDRKLDFIEYLIVFIVVIVILTAIHVFQLFFSYQFMKKFQKIF